MAMNPENFVAMLENERDIAVMTARQSIADMRRILDRAEAALETGLSGGSWYGQDLSIYGNTVGDVVGNCRAARVCIEHHARAQQVAR